MRILYVEDTLINLCLVERVARMGKHEVIHYTFAEHAIENVARDKPDIALVDIWLDGQMSGIDLIMEMRDAGYTFPIIAITALANDDVRDRSLAAGCTEYFVKPVPVRQLVRLLEKYDEQIAARAALDKAEPARVVTPQTKEETKPESIQASKT